MGVLDRIREIIGKGGISVPTLEDAAVGTPRGDRTRANDRRTHGTPSDGIVITEEYRAVDEALRAGAPIVFVTGGAGSGKSTLIHWLLGELACPAAVVAPTGIAALNAGGATIHSFFKLPPRLLEPDDVKRVTDRKLYEKLRLLVVDEISMVRADVMDAICRFLELNGPEPGKPHGGVQLLLVGDLFQLPPVVEHRDLQRFFRRAYRSPHFFSAHAFRSASIVPVEMEQIFRQRDPTFTQLLNGIREGRGVEAAVALLNEKCTRTSEPVRGARAPRVILTPTNQAADLKNADALAALPGEARLYPGVLEGRFDPDRERLPSPQNLELKVGAQVMFTKNDPARRWVNGTLGIVRELHPERVRVALALEPGDVTHDVEPVAWDKIRYVWNERTERIEKEVLGRYVQLPLMLAWSATIHKAQGQTLDAVEIDLGHGAFAPGQAYVALSRCRELSGITLTRAIRPDDVKCDPEIVRFYGELRRQMRCG
ncbi:MAG: AAA family ATPase [Thermodesulfobacteriota bacterium]